MQEEVDAGDVTPVRGNTKATILAFSFCVLAFAFDRWTKVFFLRQTWGTRDLMSGVLALTHHYNHGLLANLPVPLPASLALGAAALAALVYAVAHALRHGRTWEILALGMVLGGACGNLYDRLVYGYVFDWLMFFNISIINLADAWIAAGIVAYVFAHWRRTRVERQGIRKDL